MANREILKLVAGFKRFRDKYYAGEDPLFSKLSVGQNPSTLIIGCSDSRVDPALISSASPGELFIVRNVANLVPPYESSGTGRHGVSAAIEFAVVHLKVQNVVVLGHRQCGGIRALMSGQTRSDDSFIGAWMEIVKDARDRVFQKHPNEDFEIQCKHCELEGIKASMDNLKTFPFVRQAIETREMNILGIYFDLENGALLEYEPGVDQFVEIKI